MLDLAMIIQALRLKATSFAGRVAGAAEFQAAMDTEALQLPAAWVVPMADEAEMLAQNVTAIRLTERFAVMVGVSNAADERGQTARVGLTALRTDVWRAILGWQPSADDGPIAYEGGDLLAMDRARMFYRLDFSMVSEAEMPSRQADDLAALGDLEEVRIKMDMIDPAADPNTPPVTDPELGGYHGGYPGPDGRIEHETRIPLPPA
ncbi:MAG: hypothetical protein IPI58_09900 [Alphaproteobacteria bacterium]|nr:MAG: hypothetical protein IPI58_09900 [Alphaproteobacteria bacterium]